MPYIVPSNRTNYDSLIDQLAERIVADAKECGYDGAFAGLLNYIYTRLALKVVKMQFGKMRYWLIAVIAGVFKNAGDEFYRRVAAPYEEEQAVKNGDVDLYKEFQEEIQKIKNPLP